MWQPSIQDFKEVFTNQYTLNILIILRDKQSTTPSELANILEIHISTAKKYLELLYKHNFLTKEIQVDKIGRPSIYSLKNKIINISLNLNNFEGKLPTDQIEIWNPLIREAREIDRFATYIFDQNDLINTIKLKIKTKARRYVTLSIELSDLERLFMKYLPLPTMEAITLMKICYKANIQSIFEIKSIESFVKKLQKYSLIEIPYE